jgi:hypothetical protein
VIPTASANGLCQQCLFMACLPLALMSAFKGEADTPSLDWACLQRTQNGHDCGHQIDISEGLPG